AYPFAGPSHAIEVQLPLLLLGLALLPGNAKGQGWTWLLLLPIALQVGYLGSNAARLGLAAASIYLWWRNRKCRPALIAALVLVVGGELLRSLLGGESILPEDTTPRGVSVRKEIYLSAAGHGLSHPLGIGIGRFESDYPEWRSAEEARLSSGNWKDTSHRIPKTPHQEILLPFLELGWLGFLLLGAAALRLVRARPTMPTDSMWIGLLTMAMFRSPFSDNPTALAIAALVLGSEFAGHRSSNPGPRISLLPAALAVLAVIPAWAQIRGERAVALAVQDQDRLEQHLLDALDARPWDNRSLVLLGSLYLAGQQWDAARNCFDSALVHNPTDLAALTAYIKVEMYAPDGDEVLMLRLLARGEQFAPFHPSVKQARILWLEGYRQAFQDEAVRRVQQGIPEAGAWWTATYLAEAYIAAVEDKPQKVRDLLFRASALAPGGNKGLLERTAEKPSLEPDDIAQLTRKVFPQWPRVTY
ncbi:MAG: tetratricopeptide repeat protein, partial [Planctomycetota bacterium]